VDAYAGYNSAERDGERKGVIGSLGFTLKSLPGRKTKKETDILSFLFGNMKN
jgi:hypothetical protein